MYMQLPLPRTHGLPCQLVPDFGINPWYLSVMGHGGQSPPVLGDEASGTLGELRTMEGDCAQDLSLSLFITIHPVH